jgi:hypothetical protein
MSILFGLSLGAKLLGLGGGTGLLGFGARLLGWDRKAIGLAKRVPPKVWYALAIVAALIAAYFIHQHHMHKIIAAAKLEQKQADEKAFAAQLAHVAAQANAIRVKSEQAAAAISKTKGPSMKKLFAATLLLPMLCSCADQARPQAIADRSIIPAYPPAPVDISAPLPKPMLPDLKCLQATGQPCPGAGKSAEPRSTTTSSTK